MSERIFHWVRQDDLVNWLVLGWVMVPPNAPMHHHDYSFLCEWLCACKMVVPA